MNLYWDQLQGQKLISQHANAGHGLEGSQQEAMHSGSIFQPRCLEERTAKDPLGNSGIGRID